MDDQAAKKKPMACPKCGNRLRVLAEQLGTEIMCPKCRATFVVGRPQPPQPAAVNEDDPYEPEVPLTRSEISPLAPATANTASSPRTGAPTPIAPEDDAYEPEIPLTRCEIAPVEPMSGETEHRIEPQGYEADWSTAEHLEAESHHRRPVAIDDHLAVATSKGMLRRETTPRPPTWTFFSGVFTFPWRGPNAARWTGMALGLSMTAVLGMATAGFLGFGADHVSGSSMMGIPLALVTISSAVAALSLTAVSFLASLQDTADGHDEVQDELPELGQWVFTLLSLLTLWSATCAIGYPLSLIEPIGRLGPVISSFVLFPVLLLSALEADSFLLPFSPPILRTLVRCGWTWAVFYGLALAMLVAFGLLFELGRTDAPYVTMLLSGPVAAWGILVYGRLLGRLAWRASGMPPAPVDGNADDRSAVPVPRRGRRKRVRMPEGLDEAAQWVAESPTVDGRRLR